MTISPPSNVKVFQSGSISVLASGIDSLSVSLQIEWQSTRLFELLTILKVEAKKTEQDQPARLEVGSDKADWLFVVKPHGKDGYEWILTGSEMTLKVANWQSPKQRPSVMVDIRSETLWTHGLDAAVNRVLSLIEVMDGLCLVVKPSRVDVCVDVLLPADVWEEELRKHFVTRAHQVNPHFRNGALTGFSIGRGVTSARLYDKALEIETKSGKVWMYDIWKLRFVPPDFRVIRVEFQVRRERLKELGCNTWTRLQVNLPGLWNYCAKHWLRLVEDASAHHTQQVLFPWWQVVVDGFVGAQGANELVREKTFSVELARHANQIVGGLGSIVAIESGDDFIDMDAPMEMASYCHSALDIALENIQITDLEFTERVAKKQPRYSRSATGFVVKP